MSIEITNEKVIQSDNELLVYSDLCFECIPYDEFLKTLSIVAQDSMSMMINLSEVNNHFYEGTRDLYKRYHPFDILLDTILSENRYGSEHCPRFASIRIALDKFA